MGKLTMKDLFPAVLGIRKEEINYIKEVLNNDYTNYVKMFIFYTTRKGHNFWTKNGFVGYTQDSFKINKAQRKELELIVRVYERENPSVQD